MAYNNSKINTIFKGITFTKDEIKLVESLFHKVKVNRGTVLINVGDTVDHHYYIIEGCLRSFYTDINGKEHTVQFGIDDWWISDYTAFFTASDAIMQIEVIQDSILYRISNKDKEHLYSKFHKIESFFRVKLEKAFASFQKRILSSLSQSATERYLNFVNTYPEIEKKVKNYHIASYLGITTESLSRIRKELSK